MNVLERDESLFFFSPGESTYRICVIASRRSDLREERLLRKEEARSILVLDGMARLIRERVFEEVDEQENMGQAMEGFVESIKSRQRPGPT